jgi:hypothetical protein
MGTSGVAKSVGGLVLEASCAAVRVGGQDELVVQAWIVNIGPTPVNISHFFFPPQILWLEFADSAGREVRYEGFKAHLAMPGKEDFVRLDSGQLYGVRVRLVPEARGRRGGRYTLIHLPDSPTDGHYLFGAPGRYSLTVRYSAGENVRHAGVAAWTGTLQSEKIWFDL